MSYYYLVASLPGLDMESVPPLTVDAFRFQCQGPLSSEDYEDLLAVLDDRPADGRSAFARTWAGIEAQLRNGVARQRAAKRGVEVKSYLRPEEGFDGYAAKSLSDAYARGNPLEREQILDRCRWYLAEELAVAEPYELSAVLAFAVKLRLAERWSRLKDEAGMTRWNELVGRELQRENITAELDVLVD